MRTSYDSAASSPGATAISWPRAPAATPRSAARRRFSRMATDSSMSVVHVLWSGGVGGIERLVHDLAREQSRLGFRVSVAFAQPSGPFARRLREGGVPV